MTIKFKITPVDRGADPIEEIPDSSAIPSDSPLPEPQQRFITEIVNFGTGWIDVKYSDGSVEHRSGGTIAWRYNNPGNLKFGPFARENNAVGAGDGGHSVFPTYQAGESAMRNLLFTNARGYDTLSLSEMVEKYAPSSDGNNPESYARFIAQRVGVSVNTTINRLTNRQKADMIEAMKIAEGYQVGQVSSK